MSDLNFLAPNADQGRLQRAALANHRSLFVRSARAVGGEVFQAPGVMAAAKPGETGDINLVFSGMTRPQAEAHLDAVVEFCRSQSGSKSVLCWSLAPSRPADLGLRLIARGFEWCWQPNWMALDLSRLNDDHSRPAGITVAVVQDEGWWEVEDLPYYDAKSAIESCYAVRRRPHRFWRFAAWLDGKVVGHTSLNLTTGPLGVAGIYGVGVVPAMQRQGIGKAVVAAACRHARDLGCHYALLNGTGEQMYRQIGFEQIGYGLTWYMPAETLTAATPSTEVVHFLEAAGRGDIAQMDALRRELPGDGISTALAGGITALHIAAGFGQPEAAAWLVEHGADTDRRTRFGQCPYTIAIDQDHPALAEWLLPYSAPSIRFLEACGRGDREAAHGVLRGHPDAVRSLPKADQTWVSAAAGEGNLPGMQLLLDAGLDIDAPGDWGGSPIHHAAWNGRSEMVRLLIERGASIDSANDFGGKPLGAAIHGSLQCRNSDADYAAAVEHLLAAGAAVPDRAGGSEAVAAVLRRQRVAG